MLFLISSNIINKAKQPKSKKSHINYQQGLLESLLASYAQPAFIIDEYGYIKVSNNKLDELNLSINTNITTIEQLIPIINFINSTRTVFEFELMIREECYLVNCSKFKVSNLDWLFISFSKITYIKRIQKQQTTFIQDASHEIKTPVTSIKGLCELIIDKKVVEPEKIREFIKIIYKENERLGLIINKLTISNNKQLNVCEFFIEQLFDEIRILFIRHTDANDVCLIFKSQPNLVIKSDPLIIKQVLVNLIDNSFKYSERGNIDVSARIKNKKVIIIVKDCGIGIPKKDLPFIFDRFYRVDHSRTRSSGGSGLGLSIVKQLLRSINSEISVSSVVDEGSTFTISIPIE
ncbi:MAG: sensor histidine kinase [Bacilli bacterium]